MAYVSLPYQLVDFESVIEHYTFEYCAYDKAVDDVVNFFQKQCPEYEEKDIREQVHGLFFRIGLARRMYRIELIGQYIQQQNPEVYAELSPFEYDVRNYSQFSNKIKEKILVEYPELVPGINEIFFLPKPLPQIQSDAGGMQEFIDSVRYSLATKNWFGALFMALALPDICGVLTDGAGVQVGVRYKKWFNTYLKIKYDPANEYEARLAHADLFRLETLTEAEIETLKLTPVRNASALNFTAADCYGFRCKALHQGLAQRSNDPSTRIQFSPTRGATIHRSYIDGKWWLSIDAFCEDVCQAVEKWLVDVKDDATIQGRLRELMTI